MAAMLFLIKLYLIFNLFYNSLDSKQNYTPTDLIIRIGIITKYKFIMKLAMKRGTLLTIFRP